MSNIVKIQQKSRFYAQIEKGTQSFLKKQVRTGQGLLRETILGHWRTGEFLVGVREELKRRPGQSGFFIEWVELELGLSKSNLYRHIGFFEDFPNLPELVESAAFGATMKAFLALPDDPEIRQTAMELAATGDFKTVADANALAEASKPAPPASSDEFIAAQTPPAEPAPEVHMLSYAEDESEDEDPFADESPCLQGSSIDAAPTEVEPRVAIEFLIGDEAAGLTNKGEYVIGIVTSIYPDDADGRGMVFVKGESHGACYTDQLTLATGQYLSGVGTLADGQLVAWEYEGQTTYGRFLEYSGDPERICVTDFFDPSKQYEPKLKALDVRRWTIEDRKAALAIRDTEQAPEPEPEKEEPAPPEPTLEERLAALPLAQALGKYAHRGHLFLQNANLWHQCEKAFKGVQNKASNARHIKGPVADFVKSAGAMNPPEKWEGCRPCKGSLRVDGDPCETCHGVGFTTRPGEGVTPDVVAAYAAEFIRQS